MTARVRTIANASPMQAHTAAQTASATLAASAQMTLNVATQDRIVTAIQSSGNVNNHRVLQELADPLLDSVLPHRISQSYLQ